MGDLEKALPGEIVNRAMRSGNELVLSLEDARDAVGIAGQIFVAVLGVEVFRLLDIGLATEIYSGYDFKPDGTWKDFVTINNEAALRFLDENSFGRGYGYILTATSQGEFRELGEFRKRP
jgi:hypothetical protein